MIIALILLSLGLAASLLFSVKCVVMMFELNEKHEELADQIESSLDILDDCYQRITKATETPVVSDDPVVKALLLDMNRAKDAVLLIANKIVSFDQPDVDVDKEAGN